MNIEAFFLKQKYTRNIILKGRASNTTKVEEAMTKDLPIVDLNDSVEYCMNLINSHIKPATCLPIMITNLQIVITIHDLLRQVIASKEEVFDNLAKKLLDDDEDGRIY